MGGQIQVERIQTGMRVEKRILKTLKSLAEYVPEAQAISKSAEMIKHPKWDPGNRFSMGIEDFLTVGLLSKLKTILVSAPFRE